MNEITITSQIRCSRVPKLLVAVIIDGVEDTYHTLPKISWEVFPSIPSEKWGELTLSQNKTCLSYTILIWKSGNVPHVSERYKCLIIQIILPGHPMAAAILRSMSKATLCKLYYVLLIVVLLTVLILLQSFRVNFIIDTHSEQWNYFSVNCNAKITFRDIWKSSSNKIIVL